MSAANDNVDPTGQSRPGVRIIGYVGEGQRVTITDPDWRPAPTPAAVLHLIRRADGQSQS